MTRHARLALLLILATPLVATAQVTLKIQIPDNWSATTTTTAKTAQVLSIAGMDIETNTAQKVITKEQAGTRDPTGIIQVNSVIEAMKTKSSFPGGVEIVFDSTRENTPAGTQFDVMLDLYKVMASSKISKKYNKQSRCVSLTNKMEGFDELDPTIKEAMKDVLEEDYLAEAENQRLKDLPSKPVNKGDTWPVTMSVRLGGGQVLELKQALTYQGEVTTKSGAKAHSITGKVISATLEQDPNANTPAKITGSELKVESSSQKILFDNDRGMIVLSELKFRLVGDLKLDINGMELPGKLDLTIEVTALVK